MALAKAGAMSHLGTVADELLAARSCKPTTGTQPKEHQMTSNARPDIRILGSLRSADGKGVVRMEERVGTSVGDVWSALTDPSRLARWYGDVEGDLGP